MISGFTTWLFDNSRMPNSMYKNTYDTFPHLSIKNLLITTRHQYDVFINFSSHVEKMIRLCNYDNCCLRRKENRIQFIFEKKSSI